MGAALSGLMMARREVKHRSAKAPIGSVIGDSSAPRLCVSYCGASNPVASRDRRFSDLPTSRKVPDMERSPEGERLDRHGWLAAGGTHKAAAVADEEVGNVVGTMVPIHD